MARVTSRDRRARHGRPSGRPHGVLQHGIFLAHDWAWLADHGGAANLRELAPIAGRDLGEDDVADVEDALAGGAHREIVLRGAHQQEIVLGAKLFHEAIELGRELDIRACRGARIRAVPVAALGDRGGVLRRFQFVRGAYPRQIARKFVGGLRQAAQRRLDAGHNTGTEQGKADRKAARHSDMVFSDRARQRRGKIVGPDGVVRA